MKNVFEFLTGLKDNNNREWFQANKKQYDESREKVLFITELLISEIRKFDNDVPAMDPKDCLFRIYRDVRFSHDKQPYKTHFGSYIARGGRKSTRAGYYFHIDPAGSFLGGGIYMPESNVLKALRTAIYEQPEAFMEIINNTEFKKFYPAIEGEKLKTNPKGFDPAFEYMDLLRFKWYAFSQSMDTNEIINGNFTETAVEAFRALYPVNKFLNDALDNYL
jgi:uncharacterized protein (TIGR02453 family)